MPLAPLDTEISIAALTDDPYPIYRRLRRESPVLRVQAVGRTMLTKAAHTRAVKDNPALFSSNDPNTPMQRAFNAHTLMRKDGAAHMRERSAMQPAFGGKAITGCWMPVYQQVAQDYVARLPKDETVDLFKVLCAPFAARGLAHLLGVEAASDAQMIYWSQTLINGAGNFGGVSALFAETDKANAEMDALFDELVPMLRAEPNMSALSVMVNAPEPIEMSQIYSNIKIAIGGGLNEPRDALATILFGLLSDPEQRAMALETKDWGAAFDEGVRWVAPIQVSSRLVLEDTEIGGLDIPKGETVMTIQASANRDEELVDNGEVFDMGRGKVQHQAFGNGPHFCQGMHVARRMLAGIMLPLLFERFPNMRLDRVEDVVWKGFSFRGPLNLPVRLAG